MISSEGFDEISKADDSLDKIEDMLKAPGSEEEYHLFRTFLLIHPNGSVDDWKVFSSSSIFSSFSKILDALPVCTLIILCRRHFSEIPYFLNFFDRSSAVQMQPKSYLPFLCHRIKEIPIQWVVNHILKVSDVRYAYQFLTAAFTNGIKISPNQLQVIEEKNRMWKQYLEIAQCSLEMNMNEAWNQMVRYRALMKQILDFKLSISLSDFRRFDKNEFITKQLNDCPTPLKFTRTLKTAIVGFCKANSIDLEPIIVKTVSHRDWTVQQKLSIVQEFVTDPENQKNALITMTFKNIDELELIRNFAKKKKIKYEPLPDNFIEAISNEPSSRLSLAKGRYSSIEFISSATDSDFAANQDVSRSTANFFIKSPKKSTASKSLGELANGKPDDPHEYISKLRPYLNLKEIAPLIALAKYNIVVSYDQFSSIETRKEILKALVQEEGSTNIILFLEILQLSDDEIVSTLCCDQFLKMGDAFVIELSRHINRANSHIYLDFVNKILECTITNDVSEACNLWIKNIANVFDYFDADTLFLISKATIVYTSLAVSSNILSKQQLLDLYNCWKNEQNNKTFADRLIKFGGEQYASIAYPQINSSFNKESFINGYKSKDLLQFSTSLEKLKRVEKANIIDYIVSAIPEVNGRLYSRILCLYQMLKENQMNFSNEIATLHILTFAPSHNIDFHALNKDPLTVLTNSVNTKNIWDLLPLEKIYKLHGDTLLLHLMINKIKSELYDDYKQYIARLDHKSSLKPLLQKLPSRFTTRDRISFYQGIGCIDIKKKEQTEYDLRSYALNEYIKPELLQNPSKLICELYSKLTLHEKLGHSLHSLCSSIANRYDLHISRLCEHLLGLWLNENIKSSVEDSQSIYIETFEEACERDDQTNIQKSLFVLRTWKPRTAAKWLIRFIYQSDPERQISYRAKSKAIICLYEIADQALISDAFKGNFEDLVQLNVSLYYSSRLELFDVNYDLSEFTSSTIVKTIKKSLNLHPGALCTIFEMCLNFKFDDKDILLNIIGQLCVTRKRFLLRNFNRFFITFPQLKTDVDFQHYYIIILSAPINEMICQQVKSRLSSHHLAVIRDLFDLIAAETVLIPYLIIENKKVSWGDAISQICSSGMSQFAADLGAHLVGNKTRNEALYRLLQDDKYDEALYAGFDKDLVFSFILKNDLISNATSMFVDEHFVLFTAWLKRHHKEEAITQVKEALLSQGRTKEVCRMEARLSKQVV